MYHPLPSHQRLRQLPRGVCPEMGTSYNASKNRAVLPPLVIKRGSSHGVGLFEDNV